MREVLDRIDSLDDQQKQVDLLEDLRGLLAFIESGRFDPMLASLSTFLSKLDHDEAVLFTRRNPDMVEWVSVWNRANGFAGNPELVDISADILTGKRVSRRVGSPDREYGRMPHEGYQPPLFKRPAEWESTIDGMIDRRRSYRNWSPFEFADAVGVSELNFENRNEKIELPRGTLRELHFFTEVFPDLDVDDFEPGEMIGVRRGIVVQQLMERVEAGRYVAAIDDAVNFYAHLDPDEQMAFVLRNPGLSTWMGIWGMAKGLAGPHENELSGNPWPPMGEAENAPGSLEEALGVGDVNGPAADIIDIAEREMNGDDGNPRGLSDEEKIRRLTDPQEGDVWPGTWKPFEPEFAFTPIWRNDAGAEVRLAQRRQDEPFVETSTGESFSGLRLPEMHDVVVDFMEDNPDG